MLITALRWIVNGPVINISTRDKPNFLYSSISSHPFFSGAARSLLTKKERAAIYCIEQSSPWGAAGTFSGLSQWL